METQIWYRVSNYSNHITEAEVTRSTPVSVWTLIRPLFDEGDSSERRVQRDSSYETYYPDFDSAVDHLRKRIDKAAKAAAERVEETSMVLKLLETPEVLLRKVTPHKTIQHTDLDP